MVTINKELPEKLHPPVQFGYPFSEIKGQLFMEALGENFIPIRGKEEKTQNLIEYSIESNNCFSVEENGKLLGLLAGRLAKYF